MEPFIEYVCDAHKTVDRIGPFVTRFDGAWAYCAGHGAADHKWRRIPPIARIALESLEGPEPRAAG